MNSFNEVQPSEHFKQVILTSTGSLDSLLKLVFCHEFCCIIHRFSSLCDILCKVFRNLARVKKLLSLPDEDTDLCAAMNES